ncbi:hypothetical protein LOSG293_340160 [Secundilactobacillus oryzae JCM 18671]|uniref:Integral membrane protein n=1 Tax=Secundilactobacillus oryzae JCM 18671 TaxID=1291743 RepID=A0A081BKE4_9LACO|nr:DUF308 domain-containing protein [Secundilactobacillus oryzae]GAK48512.1 hypothetical protein LOSG293_340160 [Secundilactobacillus oryzae JCM 18671]
MFEFNRRSWGFDWHEFITGVLFIVAAFALLSAPKVSAIVLAFLMAVMAILSGLTTLAAYTKLRDYVNGRAIVALIIGILDILIGLVFLFDYQSAIVTLGYLFGLWFIFDSVERLLVISHIRQRSSFYWISLILNILGLVAGILVFIHPWVAVLSINFMIVAYLLIFGVNAILVAFARR